MLAQVQGDLEEVGTGTFGGSELDALKNWLYEWI